MHIPDGFLSLPILGVTWLISIGGIGFCINKTKEIFEDKMVPLMGVMSAFIFAAQMINFPIIGGTSGHLLGGVLAAVLLGPFAAAIVIACVLLVQCFIFQDGGLSALGANILNMTIISTIGGYFVYKFLSRLIRGTRGIIIAAAVASWLSVVMAAGACALELAFSKVSPLKIVLPVMVFIHALIGMVEALVTCLIIEFIIKVRPDLVYKYVKVVKDA